VDGEYSTASKLSIVEQKTPDEEPPPPPPPPQNPILLATPKLPAPLSISNSL